MDRSNGGIAAAIVAAAGKVVTSAVENQHLAGPSFKAQMANGLDELRQAFHPGVQQIQPGNAPGLWGMPTTGEATADRLAEREQDLPALTYEVPHLTLDKMRGTHEAQAEQTAPNAPQQQQAPPRDRSRGPEM